MGLVSIGRCLPRPKRNWNWVCWLTGTSQISWPSINTLLQEHWSPKSMEIFILTSPHPSPKVIHCLSFDPWISSSPQCSSYDIGRIWECLWFLHLSPLILFLFPKLQFWRIKKTLWRRCKYHDPLTLGWSISCQIKGWEAGACTFWRFAVFKALDTFLEL